jgi:hypothetical protein
MTTNGNREGAVVITGVHGIGRPARFTSTPWAGASSREFGPGRTRAHRAEGSGRLSPILLDVTDPDAIARAAKEVGAEVGAAGLAGLVNNAGIVVSRRSSSSPSTTCGRNSR